MYKRGISTLIATVLIIGITISAFGIVYTFVMPLIKENIEANRLCGDVKVMINTQKGYTCYNSSAGQVMLQVSRGPDNINISSLQFKVSGGGNSNTVNLIDGVKPVALFHMDEGLGATSIIDSSGNGHTGMINITYRVPGKLGNALNFDGTNSYIDTSFIPLYDRSFTVGAWVKTGNVASDQMIITQGPGGQSQGLHLMIRNSRFYFGFYYDDIGGNALLSNDVWYYVVFRYDSLNNEQAIYINGVIDSSGVVINDYQGITGNTGIGKAAFDFNYFNGTIDEVSIWNKSLSATDISNLYNSGNGQNSNLIEPNSLAGYWPLDESSGITAADLSGQNNKGTLINFKSTVEYIPSGKFGGAYEFDGSYGYIDIPNSKPVGTTFTVSAWIKTSYGDKSYYQYFISQDAQSFNIRATTGYPHAWTATLGMEGSIDVADGKWHHLVVTRDSSNTGKIYVDGKLDINKIGWTGAFFNNTDGYEIGRDDSGKVYPFNGTIDEVAIYDRALNPDEIKNLYESYRIVDKVISPNGERTYVISVPSLNLNNVDSASVAPIVKVGNKNHACSMMPDINIAEC